MVCFLLFFFKIQISPYAAAPTALVSYYITFKKCNNPDCNKQPKYNFINERKALYCKEHKLVDMIETKYRKKWI